MSLAVLADHMASKGRGPDSMLIHMSPREVQGLQALATANGGSLTINPETGLPEAGVLDKLLPTIIGAGLSMIPGVGPLMAAGIVGGIQTVRTGDIGKGLAAGLGAYGGANLTAGLMEAGTSTIGAAEAANGLTMSPELLAEFGGEGAKDALLQQQVTDRMAAATPFEKLSSGFDAVKNNPMGMAKSLASPLMMAAGPAILAGANVKANMPQTVTKPGMITPYASFGGQFVAGNPYQATPTRAAEGGLMGMNDGGYAPGQLDFAQRSEPVVRMASGGIAGYAVGGDVKQQIDAAYAAGDYAKVNELAQANKITATDVGETWKGFDTSGLAGLGINLFTPPTQNTVAPTQDIVAPTQEIVARPSTPTPTPPPTSRPPPMPEPTSTSTQNTVVDSGADLAQEQTWTGGIPNMREWMDATGADANEAAGLLYNVVGSTFEKDPRDWNAIMNSADPAAAARAATAQMYGGPGRIEVTDYGGMLVGGDGTKLTSDLSRYKEFGIALNPDELKAQRDAIARNSPQDRARWERINMLYQQALADQAKAATGTTGTTGTAGLAGLASNAGITDVTKTAGTTDVTKTAGTADLTKTTGTTDATSTPSYTSYSDAQVAKWFLDNPTATDAQIQTAIRDSKIDPAAVNRYIASLTSGFKGSTADERGSGTFGIYNQFKAQGITPDEYYAAAIANDPKYAGWTKQMIQEGYDLNKAMYALSDAKKGVVTDTDWAKLMVGKGTWDKPQYDPNEMAQATGLSIKEVQARFDLEKAKANPVITCGAGFKLSADGKSCVPDKVGVVECGPGFKLSIDGKSCVRDTVVTTQETSCPTGYHWDKTANACVKNVDATQTTTTTVDKPTRIDVADKTALPVGVSGAGVTTINPNGTVTTRPDLSLGMKEVRDAYEAGGGNLGVNKNLFVPKTTEELEDRYKLTGGSKQAMDYLTGKTKYTPVPYTEDGQVAKSYAESVMKIPRASSSKMYIFKDGKFVPNPEYAIPTYDSKGVKSTNLTNADVKTFMDKGPSADAFYTWATTNNLSPEQIALASGKPINEISKLYTGAKELTDEEGKIDQTKVDAKAEADFKANFDYAAYLKANPDVQAELDAGKANFGSKDDLAAAAYEHYLRYGKAQKRPLKAAGGLLAGGGLAALTMARGGMAEQYDLGGYSDGGRLLRGPGDGVSDSIPATIGNKRPARLADGEFVVPARIVSELGNGSTEAGARKLYAMMDRVQKARRGTVGKGRVAKNSRADKYLPV